MPSLLDGVEVYAHRLNVDEDLARARGGLGEVLAVPQAVGAAEFLDDDSAHAHQATGAPGRG